MPANIVQPGQEAQWRRAKRLADQQGHADDWPYVVSIFKRLVQGGGDGGGLSKAEAWPNDHSVAFVGRGGRWPGQVPVAGMALVREAERPPRPRYLEIMDGAPTRTAAQAVAGLGLTVGQEADWEQFVRETVDQAKSPIEIRQAVNRRARDQGLTPIQRSELTRRAAQYARQRLQKSVAVYSAAELRGPPVVARPVIFPDELAKAGSGGALGGKYFRRVPKPGGGYRYYYKAEQYQRRPDAHVGGEEARKAAIEKAVGAAVGGAGAEGLDVRELRRLAKRHGRDAVAAHLSEQHKSGALKFKKGRLYAGEGARR